MNAVNKISDSGQALKINLVKYGRFRNDFHFEHS